MAATSTRFPKGISGNPRGRPARPRPAAQGSAFDVIVDRRLTVTAHGIERELTVDEALQQRIYQDALKGKRMAIRTVMKWIAAREAALPPPVHDYKPIETRIQYDPANADEALLLLGIAGEHPEREPPGERRFLLLEPWAVRRALSRRSGARLGRKELDEIRRETRDPATIRWPAEHDA